MSSYTRGAGDFNGWEYNGGVWQQYGTGDPGPKPYWVPDSSQDPYPNEQQVPSSWTGGAPQSPGGDGGGGGSSPPGGLPGYGMSQNLTNFGVPGFETNAMQGGGSWEGTTFGGAPYTGLQYVPIPNSDTTNPSSPYYRGPVTNPDGTPIGPGISIKPAIPYQTSVFQQTYSDKPAPYPYVHAQIGEAMKGIQAAQPGFAWATPERMAQGQASATGAPPGGWTQMLGFTPGQPTNYGFPGGRPNPYGITGMPLGYNPAAGNG